MFCKLKIINLLNVTMAAKNSKQLWFETWHMSFLQFYIFLLSYIVPQQILQFVLRLSFFKWKLMFLVFPDTFFLFFFWCHYLLPTAKQFTSLFWIFIGYIRVLFLLLVVFMELFIFYVVSFDLILFLPLIKLKHDMQVFHVFSLQLCSTTNCKVSFHFLN